MTKRNEFKRRWYPGQGPFTAGELIELGIYADRDGATEAAAAQAENVTKAFARLAELLFEKGTLTRSDVYYLAGESEVD